MGISMGTCPVCQQDEPLTPARQLVSSHVVNGQKCAGVGKPPLKVTQRYDPHALRTPSASSAPGSRRSHAKAAEDHGPAEPVAPTRAERNGRRVRLGLLALAVIAVVAISVSVKVDNHRDQVATARRVAFCNGLEDESSKYVTASGVSFDGKAWAQAALDSWPAEFANDCSFTRTFLEEMVSGVVDSRLAAQNTPAGSSSSGSPDQGECERRIATMMDMDIDEQSRRDNVDSIRIDCDLPPLQQDQFWQDAWARHQQNG